MSGGTIIACACKEILMGTQSSLGPIDPQINGLPALLVLSEFYRANKEIANNPDKINIWKPILSRYHPSLIETCEKIISWSKELAQDYLSGSMFKEELSKNDQQTHDTINNIIHILTDENVTKSHSRHIPTPVCMQSGLKVKYIEDDQELQDIILSIHHASTLTIVNTSSQDHRKSKQSIVHISVYC